MMNDMISRLVDREGGFVDDPHDKGGATKYGITAATLGEWRKYGRYATREEVKNLEKSEAIEIYGAFYLIRPGISQIKDDRLQELVFDAGVHHGVRRAIKWLQRIASVNDDGVIGPITLSVVNNYFDPRKLRRGFMLLREDFVDAILQNDPSQQKFADGWHNRLNEMWELV